MLRRWGTVAFNKEGRVHEEGKIEVAGASVGRKEQTRWKVKEVFAGNAEISEGLKVLRRGAGNNPHLALYGLVPLWQRSRYLTGLTIVPKVNIPLEDSGPTQNFTANA